MKGMLSGEAYGWFGTMRVNGWKVRAKVVPKHVSDELKSHGLVEVIGDNLVVPVERRIVRRVLRVA
jgi:hypothetical protein